MKVVAFNGSARKDGNTAALIKYIFLELEREGIETELVQLAGSKIQGCIACYKCFENRDKRCAMDDAVRLSALPSCDWVTGGLAPRGSLARPLPPPPSAYGGPRPP